MQEILGVAADVHIFVAVHADATDNQQPGIFLADILNDLFKRFSVEQRRFDVRVFRLSQFARNI